MRGANNKCADLRSPCAATPGPPWAPPAVAQHGVGSLVMRARLIRIRVEEFRMSVPDLWLDPRPPPHDVALDGFLRGGFECSTPNQTQKRFGARRAPPRRLVTQRPTSTRPRGPSTLGRWSRRGSARLGSGPPAAPRPDAASARSVNAHVCVRTYGFRAHALRRCLGRRTLRRPFARWVLHELRENAADRRRKERSRRVALSRPPPLGNWGSLVVAMASLSVTIGVRPVIAQQRAAEEAPPLT